MSEPFHAAQFPPGCVGTTFRLSGGGATCQRRRRLVPRQDHDTASRRTWILERRHRTRVRLTRSSPARLRARMRPCPVSHHGAEQGSRPVGGSTSPLRQRRREGIWWYGPGPAPPRGPSRDGLKTDSTGDGRSWPSDEPVLAHPHYTVRSLPAERDEHAYLREGCLRVIAADSSRPITRALTERRPAA